MGPLLQCEVAKKTELWQVLNHPCQKRTTFSNKPIKNSMKCKGFNMIRPMSTQPLMTFSFRTLILRKRGNLRSLKPQKSIEVTSKVNTSDLLKMLKINK